MTNTSHPATMSEAQLSGSSRILHVLTLLFVYLSGIVISSTLYLSLPYCLRVAWDCSVCSLFPSIYACGLLKYL